MNDARSGNGNSRSDSWDPQDAPRGVMTGGRLIELVVVTLISAGISGTIVGYGTLRVLETEVRYLRSSLEEAREEIRQLRADLYRPYSDDTALRPGDVMKIADLKTRLADSLHDAGNVFNDADLDRHVRVALRAMALHKRPRRVSGTLSLVAGQAEYDAPPGLVAIDRLLWTNDHARTPWERDYPGPAPTPALLRQSTGHKIVLTPPPDRRQVQALDGSVRLFYRAEHETTGSGADEEVTTLSDADEDLLILRAQAEACRELALRNFAKPVSMRGGTLSEPRNGTASAIYQALLDEWKAAP